MKRLRRLVSNIVAVYYGLPIPLFTFFFRVNRKKKVKKNKKRKKLHPIMLNNFGFLETFLNELLLKNATFHFSLSEKRIS